MIGIAVILISFAVAVLGFIHSHAAKDGQTAIWGLTRLGFVLVILSAVGLIVGIGKEVTTIQSGAAAKKVAGTDNRAAQANDSHFARNSEAGSGPRTRISNRSACRSHECDSKIQPRLRLLNV